MALLGRYVSLMGAVTSRLTLCSETGGIMGGLAGTVLLLTFAAHSWRTLSAPEILAITGVLAVLGWTVLITILCLWERYSFSAVAPPLLGNALLTCLVIVMVASRLQYAGMFPALGTLLGVAIGRLLCLSCRAPARSEKKGAGDAVHG